MAATPRLSICVPSRNRQYYFQKTIEGILRNPRMDFELVVADNSDEPDIMNAYMAEIKDPRVVYLPSEDRVLSMMENWERTVAATTGDWVTVIGDDDHCEPNVVDVINRAQSQVPDVEAFGWSCVSYLWPDGDKWRMPCNVPLQTMTIEIDREACFHRMFRWVNSRAVPTSGYSIYHAAISRELLERIRQRYTGSTYFEYPNVDYENAMKVIQSGRRFIYTQRPFSVMGSCPKSNSYGIARMKDSVVKNRIFTQEARRNIDDDDEVKNFPFKVGIGVTAAIGLTQEWFKQKYKVKVRDWEANFAKACAMNTESYGDIESFNLSKQRYEDAFSKWSHGAFLKEYKPEFKPNTQRLSASGFCEQEVVINPATANIETPAELFDIVNAITVTPALMDFDLTKRRYIDRIPTRELA